MIELNQLLITLLLIVLIGFLVFIGKELYSLIKSAEVTMNKASKILDDSGNVTGLIAKRADDVDQILENALKALSIFKFLKRS